MKKETLEDLIKQNYSQLDMAKKLECGRSTIRYWLNKYGLRTRHRPNKYKFRNLTTEQILNMPSRR